MRSLSSLGDTALAAPGIDNTKVMAGLLTIETKKYSEFFRRLLIEYGTGSEIRIDGNARLASELLSDWCNNREICRTRDFVLKNRGVELCGFHDHPRETWMAESELLFARRMQDEGIIRFRISRAAR